MAVILRISSLSHCLSLTLQSCWLHSGLGRLRLLPWPSACVRRCLSDVFWDIAKSMTSSTPPLPNFFSSAFRPSKSVVTEIVTLHWPTSVCYCTVYNKWSVSLITEHETGGCLFVVPNKSTSSDFLKQWERYRNIADFYRSNRQCVCQSLYYTDPLGNHLLWLQRRKNKQTKKLVD